MRLLIPFLATVTALPATNYHRDLAARLRPYDHHPRDANTELRQSSCPAEQACRWYEDHQVGSPMVAFYVYDDPHCGNFIRNFTWGEVKTGHWCKGQNECYGGDGDSGQGMFKDMPPVIYIKPVAGFDHKAAQLAITSLPIKYTCTQGVVPDLAAVISEADACFSLRDVNEDMGAAFFPCGMDFMPPNDDRKGEEDDGTPRVGSRSALLTRGDASADDPDYNDSGCGDMELSAPENWDHNARTPSLRVSDNVDCRGNEFHCIISTGVQQEKTMTTKWSIAPQGQVGAKAIGMLVNGEFGKESAWAVTTNTKEDMSVDAGQMGFLAYESKATRIPVTFKQCPDGQDHDGFMLIPTLDSGTYRVVNINGL